MRKSLVACLALALVLAGGLVALLRPMHCPVNRAAFGRIEDGMTQAEVRAILGGPPGDYRTGPTHPGVVVPDGGCPVRWLVEEWEGDEGTVEVHYHSGWTTDEKVIDVRFREAECYRPDLFELARWRLGKLWTAWLP